jgi:hypothetical protein
MFQRIVMPPSSGSSSPRRVLGIFDPEDEHLTTHENIMNYPATQCNIPENLKLQQHCCENLQSCIN